MSTCVVCDSPWASMLSDIGEPLCAQHVGYCVWCNTPVRDGTSRCRRCNAIASSPSPPQATTTVIDAPPSSWQPAPPRRRHRRRARGQLGLDGARDGRGQA